MVEFKTDIPDDTEFADDDDIVTFGGQAVARALGDLLNAQGFQVEEPEYAQEHGWEFSARIVQGKVNARIWIQVTIIDDILVVTEDTTRVGLFGKSGSGVYGETLGKLNEQLAADGRYHDVLWYTSKQYNERQPGAPTPYG